MLSGDDDGDYPVYIGTNLDERQSKKRERGGQSMLCTPQSKRAKQEEPTGPERLPVELMLEIFRLARLPRAITTGQFDDYGLKPYDRYSHNIIKQCTFYTEPVYEAHTAEANIAVLNRRFYREFSATLHHTLHFGDHTNITGSSKDRTIAGKQTAVATAVTIRLLSMKGIQKLADLIEMRGPTAFKNLAEIHLTAWALIEFIDFEKEILDPYKFKRQGGIYAGQLMARVSRLITERVYNRNVSTKNAAQFHLIVDLALTPTDLRLFGPRPHIQPASMIRVAKLLADEGGIVIVWNDVPASIVLPLQPTTQIVNVRNAYDPTKRITIREKHRTMHISHMRLSPKQTVHWYNLSGTVSIHARSLQQPATRPWHSDDRLLRVPVPHTNVTHVIHPYEPSVTGNKDKTHVCLCLRKY